MAHKYYEETGDANLAYRGACWPKRSQILDLLVEATGSGL